MKTWLIILAIYHGADAATTDLALARGAREAVTPSQHPLVLNLVDAGEAAYEIACVRRLEARHPTWARALLVAALTGQSFAVTHNLKTLGQLR